MFFVEEGSLRAVDHEGDTLMDYSRGDWFGELALLTRAPRGATVTAVGRSRLLKLGYDAFVEYIPKCKIVLDKRVQQYELTHSPRAKAARLEEAVAEKEVNTFHLR